MNMMKRLTGVRTMNSIRPSRTRRPRLLDRAILASLIAMAAMNAFVLAQQLRPAAVVALADPAQVHAA